MTIRFIRSLATLVPGVLLLTACAGDKDRYPSLAIRDIERVQGSFTPAPQSGETIRPVASDSELAGLVAKARESHSKFIEARPSASRLIEQAEGRSIESNARQRALVALADLTSIRSETALALGDLDLLYAEASTTFAPTDDISTAQTEVAGIVAEQDLALEALNRRMNR